MAVECSEICQTHLHLVLRTIKVHAWVSCHFELCFPYTFAKLRDEDPMVVEEAMLYIKQMIGFVLKAEKLVLSRKKPVFHMWKKLLNALHSTRVPLVREYWAELDSRDYTMDDYLKEMVGHHFGDIMHTKTCLEDCFNLLRHLQSQNKNKIVNLHKVQHYMLWSPAHIHLISGHPRHHAWAGHLPK
eukprot:6855102-Karenia_brevis.AAC.1